MSRYKYMPTKKLKEILDDPYTITSIGTDYGPVREELEEVYLERQARLDEKALKEYEKQLDAHY